MEKRILTREAILEASDINVELVDVPEWGGAVYVRTMTGAERDAFEATMVEKRGKDFEVNLRNLRAKLAAFTVVDEHGNRLFSEEDIQILAGKSAAALQRIFNVASRLSGVSAEDVQELAKNSAGAPSDASGSV
jgi:hypothetical protein